VDGKQARSAGIKFRQTKEIAISTTVPTYISLYPAVGNALAWTDTVGHNVGIFPDHTGTVDLRARIKSWRCVSAGLKLTLVNSAEQNEGYWEAIRVPVAWGDIYYNGEWLSVPYDTFTFGLGDFSNYASYQTGKLRDIHRYQFKLNSVSNEHPFRTLTDAGAALDTTFDMIFIRVVGRVVTGQPSVLMADCVMNQEVVYSEKTTLGRLMTPSEYIEGNDTALELTEYEFPAVQIA
jgi:hypothetical protein